METFGVDQVHGRRLLLAPLTEEWLWDDPGCERFVLFIAADATSTNDRDIERYARDSLASGCEYVCSWGPDCKRVHDAFDRVSLEPSSDRRSSSLTSAWNDGETLAEAMYFAVVVAFLDSEETHPDIGTAVVLAVQEPWRSDARALLADQDELARLFIGDD